VTPRELAESLYRIEPVDPATLEATGQMRVMMLTGVILHTPGGCMEWHESEASAQHEREACVAGLAAAIDAAVRDARTAQATEFAEMFEHDAAMLREKSARDGNDFAAAEYEHKAEAMAEAAREIRALAGLAPPTKQPRVSE